MQTGTPEGTSEAPVQNVPVQREREPFISLLLYRLFKWGMVLPVFYFYFRGRVHRPQQFLEKGLSIFRQKKLI